MILKSIQNMLCSAKWNRKALIIITLSLLTFMTFNGGKISPFGNPQQTENIKDSIVAVLHFEKAEYYTNQSNSDSAIYELLESEKLFSKIHKTEQLVRCYIKLADNYRIKKEYATAMEYISSADSLAKTIKPSKPLLFSEIYHVQGTIHRKLGEYNKAFRILQQSISNRIKVNGSKDTLLANTYNNLGNVFLQQLEYSKALEYYKTTLSIAAGMKSKKNKALGVWYQNVGIVYSYLGDYAAANRYYINAISILKSAVEANDPLLAKYYTNLGFLNINEGQYDLALNHLLKAEKIYLDKFGSSYDNLINIYLNIGVIYMNKTDFGQALEFYLKALNIIQESEYNKEQIPATYLNIGSVYSEMKLYSSAIKYLKDILVLAPEPSIKAKTYERLAEIYTYQSRFELANSHFKDAIKIIKRSLPDDDLFLARVYNNYGYCLKLQNQFNEALSYHKQALALQKNIYPEKNSNIAANYHFIGQLYDQSGDFEKALKYYQLALISNTQGFYNQSLEINPENTDSVLSLFNQLLILKEKANSLFRLNTEKGNHSAIDQSLDILRLAIDHVDELGNSYSTSSEISRLSLNDEINSLFTSAIAIAEWQYRKSGDNKYLSDVYFFSEKAKASSLLALIRTNKASEIAKVPGVIQSMERRLIHDVQNYQRLIHEEKKKINPNNSKIELWNNKVFNFSREYKKLISYIEKNYPSYYNFKHKSQITGLDQVRESLEKDEVLIEYSLSDTSLFALLISSNKTILKRIEIDSQFSSNVLKLRELLDNPKLHNHTAEDIKLFENLSNEVYNKVLKPFENILKQNHLIVIPDNVLGFLPFEILVKKKNKEQTSYKKLHYLINENSVSYAYSSTLLFSKERSSNNNGKLLAFAPQYPEQKQDSSLLVRNIEELRKLKPIPGVENEIRAISNILPSDLYLGPDASESNFKTLAGDYKVLHLAMHTLLDDNQPMFSKLVFSLDSDTSNDQLLNTYEIYQLELNARLVVLSACNTGYGKLSQGEGIISLTRGFFYAGIPSVVMTHWTVEDKAGAELMKFYYEEVSKNEKLDMALKNSKLRYLSQADELRSHPYFWSCYVSFGKTDPINAGKKSSKLAFYLIIPVVFLAAFATLIIRRRKRLK
jgi:CHAT domain-containing protein/Tfp pilus assembly protein PilF